MHDPKQLGGMIRTYRKKRGMTQAALAERLFVTAQNVSKWETGLSAPDVGNLCLLSDVLGVSTDRLLGKSADGPADRVMIGIDGGGTKTEFCLFTEQGEILGQCVLGASNPNAEGMEQTLAVLKQGIDTLTRGGDEVAAIFAGVSGCGPEANRRTVRGFLQKSYPDARIEVQGDGLNVVYSTPYFERCIVVIAGTGSVVFAKEPQGLFRLGGWGYLFDRSYSGFELGREAVAAALAEEDGVGVPTGITPLLQERLGGRVSDSIAGLYRKKNDMVASFAPLVFEAYDAGDCVAAAILEKSLRALRQFIKKAAERYDCGSRVVLAGGLTARQDVLTRFLREEGDHFTYIFPHLPPIYGACAYCNRMFGEPRKGFAERFYEDYKKRKGE